MSEDPLEMFWEVIADVEVGHRHGLIQETVFQLAAALRVSRAQLAELEGQLNPPCPDPGIDAFYLEADKGG